MKREWKHGRLRLLIAVILQLSISRQDALAADPNMAAAMGDLEQVKSILIASPAFVEERSGIGMTPLMSAAAAGENEVAKYLLSFSAKVNSQDNSGWTPLHYAVAEGRVDTAKLLLEHNADTGLKTKDGKTASELVDKIQDEEVRSRVKSLLDEKKVEQFQ